MSNVKLSAAELALACNADLLLTKNLIIAKVYDMFGHLATHYQAILPQYPVQPEVLKATPKISRGENYLGLPWVMLDYPRHFAGDDIFSIRTMFWWGKYFSQFVIVKGKYRMPGAESKMHRNTDNKEWCICVQTDMWHHHFEQDNMKPFQDFKELDFLQQVSDARFLKIGRKEPIENWDTIPDSMLNGYADGLALTGYQKNIQL